MLTCSCIGVERLLNEAVVTAFSAVEWTVLTQQSPLHWVFAPGGAAIGQLLEGTGCATMKEGKPVGNEFSGKTVFNFASGTLAALAGKTVNFNDKSTGPNRFEIVFTD